MKIFIKLIMKEKKEVLNEIVIGSHVWIGCGVKIYKGTVIPDGSVIAANSVVRGVFTTPGSLIGGHPARVLREGVHWI